MAMQNVPETTVIIRQTFVCNKRERKSGREKERDRQTDIDR